MQIYIAAAPEEARAASACGHPLAHAAYRIGPDSTLLRKNPLLQSGGVLCISDSGAPEVSDPAALCAAVLRECSRRGCTGAVLDFDRPPRRDLLAFVTRLEQAAQKRNRTLFVPESYARAAKESFVLIGTAVSGGTLEERLREAQERFGSRLALDAERLRMDFPLPCPGGVGTPLSGADFAALREREHPTVFFSPALCARYFTYRQNGQSRFVLFDDADTLRRKLRLGQQMGAAAAFFMWPEVADISEKLFD